MDWVTTSTLLERLEDFENREAWNQFAGRFRQPVVTFARSLGLTESDAEDVAQESLLAFAKAYQQGQYDPAKGRLSKWLFGIAYRQAMNSKRAAARRQAKVGAAGGDTSFWNDVADEQTATDVWDQTWEQSLLAQCLQQVRSEVEPETFKAFELTVHGGLTASAAADQLGVPVKLVYNAKHRVLKRIRELRSGYDDVA